MRTVAPDAVGTEILAQLKSADPYDQYFAVLSICDLERTELLPAVVPLLDSRLPDLRYVAVQTIGDYGKGDGNRYGPVLMPLLESDDAELRQYAAEALASIDYQESIPAIEQMLEEEVDDETRQFTERALRFLKRENTPEDAEPVFRLMEVDLSGAGPVTDLDRHQPQHPQLQPQQPWDDWGTNEEDGAFEAAVLSGMIQ